MTPDPRATRGTPDDNQPSAVPSRQEYWSFNPTKDNRNDDDGGEGNPDESNNGQLIEVGSEFEDDDHDAKRRTSGLSPAQNTMRRPEARRNGPPEDQELDGTRRERAARRLSHYASISRTSDVEDRLANEDAGPGRGSQRGYRGNVSVSNRRNLPSKDRADGSDASWGRRRGSRGRSGARPRSKKAERRNDGQGEADRASVPPSSCRGRRGTDKLSQTRDTSEEARRYRDTRSHSSRSSRGRNDEERAEGSRTATEPDSQPHDPASETRTRRQRYSDAAPRYESRRQRANNWLFPQYVVHHHRRRYRSQWRNLCGTFGRRLKTPWKIIAMLFAMSGIMCATALVAWGVGGASKKP